MELRFVQLGMQMHDELYFSFFYALERTIFIRKREATNYFRLMTPSVDQSDLNELVTQPPIAPLTDAAWSAGTRLRNFHWGARLTSIYSVCELQT